MGLFSKIKKKPKTIATDVTADVPDVADLKDKAEAKAEDAKEAAIEKVEEVKDAALPPCFFCVKFFMKPPASALA